jgi:hypothetical protein
MMDYEILANAVTNEKFVVKNLYYAFFSLYIAMIYRKPLNNSEKCLIAKATIFIVESVKSKNATVNCVANLSETVFFLLCIDFSWNHFSFNLIEGTASYLKNDGKIESIGNVKEKFEDLKKLMHTNFKIINFKIFFIYSYG